MLIEFLEFFYVFLFPLDLDIRESAVLRISHIGKTQFAKAGFGLFTDLGQVGFDPRGSFVKSFLLLDGGELGTLDIILVRDSVSCWPANP
jgi:hypothetical protein